MPHHVVLIIGAALTIMIAAAVFSRRTGVAAPLLLVGLGIGVSYLPGSPTIDIAPELILAGVLPPLLYASAVQLSVLDLRRNLSLISWLSVVLVIISAVAIGAVVHLVFPMIPLALAIALGAVVSPTDAVAATAIGRRLGLPPRLMTVLEGESLLNDASALVVLRSAVAVLTASTTFDPAATALAFVWAVVAALGVGAGVGWLTALLRRRLDDPVLNTTISFATPALAYFPAEDVGGSGILAAVVAGLVTGSLAATWFSARDRQTQSTTWATASFVLESGLFLMLGFQLPALIEDARTETGSDRIIALVALRFAGLLWPALQSRFGGRFGGRDRAGQVRAKLDAYEQRLDAFSPQDEREEARLDWARKRLARGQADIDFEEREPLTARSILVIAWAGMRGAVTLAAAQTIPTGTAHRATVVLVAGLVAMITLVLFGLTLPALIRRLQLTSRSAEAERKDYFMLVRQVAEAAIDELGPLEDQVVEGERLDPELVASLKERFVPLFVGGVRKLNRAKPGAREKSLIVQRRYIDAMRDALFTERSIGAFSSQTYRLVESLLDREEQRLTAL